MQNVASRAETQLKLEGGGRKPVASKSQVETASQQRRRLIAALLEDAREGSRPYVQGYDVERGAE